VYLKRNKKYYQTHFLLLLFLFTIISCDTNEPPTNSSISLKLEDVSCTEAWITLTTTNLQLPVTITLKKNNVAQNNILCYGDTLLYIDSLLHKQTYSFVASHSGLSRIFLTLFRKDSRRVSLTGMTNRLSLYKDPI